MSIHPAAALAPLPYFTTHCGQSISFAHRLFSHTGLLIGCLSDVSGAAAAPALKRCRSASVSDDWINSLEPLEFLQRLLCFAAAAPHAKRCRGRAEQWRACCCFVLTRFPQCCENAAEAPLLSYLTSESSVALRKRFGLLVFF